MQLEPRDLMICCGTLGKPPASLRGSVSLLSVGVWVRGFRQSLWHPMNLQKDIAEESQTWWKLWREERCGLG